MKTVEEHLLALQIHQLEHDEFFHKEITRLDIHQRLKHMALHFAKYVGKVCDCTLNVQDYNALRKTVIDSFIISITSANALNIRIADQLPSVKSILSNSLLEAGVEVAKNLDIDLKDSLWLVKRYPVLVGELAKACESVDHLEAYDYRTRIADCVVNINCLMMAAASQLAVDLVTEVPNRLMEVKKKSIFFDFFTSVQR